MDSVFVAQIGVILVTFFMLLNSAAVLVYMERKVAAAVQPVGRAKVSVFRLQVVASNAFDRFQHRGVLLHSSSLLPAAGSSAAAFG